MGFKSRVVVYKLIYRGMARNARLKKLGCGMRMVTILDDDEKKRKNTKIG